MMQQGDCDWAVNWCGLQVIIVWGTGTIVICFRGTASMKNVLHDLKVCAFPCCCCILSMPSDLIRLYC